MRDYEDATPDTGRTAYHEADEGWDDSRHAVFGSGKERRDFGVCRIRIVDRFWVDQEQEFAYGAAVGNHPKGPDEGAASYAMRISAIVEKRFPGMTTKPMPRTRLSQRERDGALQRLREQAARYPAGERPDEEIFIPRRGVDQGSPRP